MKLRISKRDHERLQRAAADIGTTTDGIVQRCLRKWAAENVATCAMCADATTTTDGTVITLSEERFAQWTADEIRTAVHYCMDLLDEDPRRVPLQLERAPAGTTVETEDGRVVSI